MPRTKAVKESESERKTTTTGVKIDLELWREFKSVAVKRGRTATEMLEAAMMEYLKKQEDTQ